jgi:hypothetical protein
VRGAARAGVLFDKAAGGEVSGTVIEQSRFSIVVQSSPQVVLGENRIKDNQSNEPVFDQGLVVDDQPVPVPMFMVGP